MISQPLNLFWRLMVKPLGREPVRTLLTILAVALGVAVVLAMDLAGDAATSSFHSSLDTLSGKQDFEVTAVGGVPQEVVGTLVQLPYDWRVTARVEGYALISATKQTLPLLGLDLIAEGNAELPASPGARDQVFAHSRDLLAQIAESDSVWVGESLHKNPGDSIQVVVNDRAISLVVQGIYPDERNGISALVMDIAAAQLLLGRDSKVDRVLIRLPASKDVSFTEWQHRVEQGLPPGVQLRPAGAATDENRKMLAAFRWNLQLLSYVALIVGAFLIYNTISISVVRRRAEIGIVRAVGGSRGQVLLAFLLEAGIIGVAGVLLGIPLGRFMAAFAVKLMGGTVNALYVTSRPGEVALGVASALMALVTGLAIVLLSAWAPAREAARVAPVEAMARARRDYSTRVNQGRAFRAALFFTLIAIIASKLPAVANKPIFGYCAALFAVAAAVFAIPVFAETVLYVAARLLRRFLDVEGLLASRSLAGSLHRTSVLVAALCTAVALMTAVGIMVGSFRQTVVEWMAFELPADLYLRPAGNPATDQHPTISREFAEKLAELPGVQAVQRLRSYEISYQGMPATLGSIDLANPQIKHSSNFLSGRLAENVLPELRNNNAAVISEPFAYKHHLQRGDTIQLPLGGAIAALRVADVYYDYSSERGTILVDRDLLLRYLPDAAPSNIAVFLAKPANSAQVRAAIERAAAAMDVRVLIFANTELRKQAEVIFDRTFAITYALEAIAVTVAILGVAGALLALVIDRRRELGLFRYLGASSRQLRRILLTEAALLGLLANLAGVALGIFLSLILIFVINKQSFGWTIHLHWPIALLLAAITLIWMATICAGYYPARIAVRLNPVEVIHED